MFNNDDNSDSKAGSTIQPKPLGAYTLVAERGYDPRVLAYETKTKHQLPLLDKFIRLFRDKAGNPFEFFDDFSHWGY